ncbi:MAG: hypothetical protein QM636_26145, partial [Rhizobium sp.]
VRSSATFVIIILPFKAQIKHGTRTIKRNYSIKLEVTFCVRGVMPTPLGNRAPEATLLFPQLSFGKLPVSPVETIGFWNGFPYEGD